MVFTSILMPRFMVLMSVVIMPFTMTVMARGVALMLIVPRILVIAAIQNHRADATHESTHQPSKCPASGSI